MAVDWEKAAGDIGLEDDALAPHQDRVVGVVAEDDLSMPEEFRGCQVVERTHAGGRVEHFYVGPDGFHIGLEQARVLIDSFRHAQGPETYSAPDDGEPAPSKVHDAVAPKPAELVVDQLPDDSSIPPQLRGAQLVDRGGVFLYLLADGETLPKEIADDLFEVYESPESTDPKAKAPETVLEELGDTDDVPPPLRGARLVARPGQAVYVTAEGQEIPKEVAEDLLEDWERHVLSGGSDAESVDVVFDDEPAETPPVDAAAPSPPAAEPAAPPPTPEPPAPPPTEEAAAPPPTAEPAAPSPGSPPEATRGGARPTGFPDMGPVTIPEATVPETLDDRIPAPKPRITPKPAGAPKPVARAAPKVLPRPTMPARPSRPRAGDKTQTSEFVPPEPDPNDTCVPLRAEDKGLREALGHAADEVRRRVGAGALNVPSGSPSLDDFKSLIAARAKEPPVDDNVARLLQRSEDLAEELRKAWAGEEARARQAIHRDLDSGTLILAALNPRQLGGLDLLELVSLIRLRRPDGTKLVTELAQALRKAVLRDLVGALKATDFRRRVLERAGEYPLVDDGALVPDRVRQMLTGLVGEIVGTAAGQVLGEYREGGLALPGLAGEIVDAFGFVSGQVADAVAATVAKR